MAGILGNMVCAPSQPRTLIIEDADGNSFTGVLVDEETLFTATDSDVREGAVYASNSGVSTGTKFIPPYYTTEGYKIITAGSEFEFSLTTLDAYDYTSLVCFICPYNTSLSNSVSTEKVVIGDKVYNSNSTDVISTVTKNTIDKTISLGITNNSQISYVLRFMTYKED